MVKIKNSARILELYIIWIDQMNKNGLTWDNKHNFRSSMFIYIDTGFKQAWK